MVYVLKKNFEFAKELKCDHYAVTNEEDFDNFLGGLSLLNNPHSRIKHGAVNNFVSDGDNLADRLEVLALRNADSKSKRILTNAFCSIVIIALFIASYSFTILPLFSVPPDIPLTEDFAVEYNEDGGAYRAEESLIFDNGDGTFSLYIDGQFANHLDDTSETFNWFPVRTREGD